MVAQTRIMYLNLCRFAWIQIGKTKDFKLMNSTGPKSMRVLLDEKNVDFQQIKLG